MADEPKPPYVQFEMRGEEDRTASLAAGHYVGTDVIYALVTPAGTRERVEKKADDWLASLEEGVKQDRVPASWLDYFKRRLADFKEGRESPENGTGISEWPPVTPSQVRMLQDMGIRTVEQLAEATEEAVLRMGMGGRALKEKAKTWLEAANDTGKLAEEVNALRVKNAELEARDAEREDRLKALEAKLEALTEKETA